MTDRLKCCVPFCKASTGRPFDEWICSRHWRAVPKSTKAARTLADRSYRKAFGDTPFWKFPPGSEKRLAAIEGHKAREAGWSACKEAASAEAAMGLV